MANKVIAVILAGGKGTRLEFLTKKIAKPAVSFAAKYRIIDFPLSNCANSQIPVVGVCTQYESTLLDSYIGNGEKWGYNGIHSLMSTLAPRQTENTANWYRGTADAITQNIDWIDSQKPDYVLILSGDHIYKTTYDEMIELHKKSNVDCTISVMEVPIKEASRFGVLQVDENDEIIGFQEKPKEPKSNLVSMGVYVFTWKVLKKFLRDDEKDDKSQHDFGKNIIPNMLNKKRKMKVYRFKKYWKDVGTISSLHEANMDLLKDNDDLGLYNNDDGTIFTEDTHSVPQYIGRKAKINRSLVNQGAIILGSIDNCVVSERVIVEQGAEVSRCVIMSGSTIQSGVKIKNAIIAPNTVIGDKREINLDGDEVVLINH